MADGERFGKPITLSEENDWKDTFYNVPSEIDGKEVTYTVEEETIEGYETDVFGNAEEGFTIINKELIDITVTKVWEGTPTDSVTIHILTWGHRSFSVDLSEENNWTHTFTSLYTEIDGEEVVYSVEEEPIEGYEVKVEGNARDGFVVTNTEIDEPEEEPKEDVVVTIEDKPDDKKPTITGKQTLPKTATSIYTFILLGTLLIVGGVVSFLLIRSKKLSE